MAKKSTKTSREQQYRDILAKDGIRFEDCRVLSFVFEYPIKTELFHYGLMAEKPDYYIFDCWDKNANVVVPKDETNEAHITLIAEQLGGQKTTTNLR